MYSQAVRRTEAPGPKVDIWSRVVAESLTCRTASRCWRIFQGESQKACESQGDTGVFFQDKIPTLQLTICAMAGKFLNPLCLCPLPGNRGGMELTWEHLGH